MYGGWRVSEKCGCGLIEGEEGCWRGAGRYRRGAGGGCPFWGQTSGATCTGLALLAMGERMSREGMKALLRLFEMRQMKRNHII